MQLCDHWESGLTWTNDWINARVTFFQCRIKRIPLRSNQKDLNPNSYKTVTENVCLKREVRLRQEVLDLEEAMWNPENSIEAQIL